jgi:photosystem II stability/assembly factor-like uncharacterized protein
VTAYTHKEGRGWFQFKKFETYKLYLVSGITDMSDPAGALTPSREPSPSVRRQSVVTDMLRGDPELPGFTVETRLQKTRNWILGIKCAVNVQVHLGRCDRPDNYYKSNMALHYAKAEREDRTHDRGSIIEGDDAKIATTTPFRARGGPVYVDFETAFLSARTITATEDITAMAFLGMECFEDCQSQEDAGENGYVATDAYAGSPTDTAQVWYTEDEGETWTVEDSDPFAPGESISDIVVSGISTDHRVIVSRGTTDAGNPAEIAYADVTDIGTLTWTNVNVGSTNGEFINALDWLSWGELFAVTEQGEIYSSDDGGVTWTQEYTSAIALNDIAALGPGSERSGYVWAVGDTNTILLSTDIGDTWSAITGPTALAAVNINTVEVTMDGTVFIGAANGSLYGSFDDGANWTLLTLQGATCTSVDEIKAWDDDVIWAIGALADGSSRCWRSTDGGASWRLWALNLPTNSGLNALEIIDPNFVFVGGNAHPSGGFAFISKTKSNLYDLP